MQLKTDLKGDIEQLKTDLKGDTKQLKRVIKNALDEIEDSRNPFKSWLKK